LLPLAAAGPAAATRADALAGWLSANIPVSSRAIGTAARAYRTGEIMAAHFIEAI
jgi:hypothetical protein